MRLRSAMVADGMDVVVLDDLSTGDPRRVPEAPLAVASIRDRELVSDALRDHHVDGVMHIAGKKQVGESVVDVPSAHSRCRAAHRCVECCRSARCAGRGCGSLMLLDANLLLYAVDRTSPPVRAERALTGPAVFLAEQVRLRGASRTAAAAVLPLAGLAAIVVAGPVRVLSPLHISRSRHQHSSEDDTPRASRGYSSDASVGAAWQGHTLALAPR